MFDILKKIELLAPAKNAEYGMAAINHGADAVYIGGPKFGARKDAGNTMADIENLCSYAHTYNAKVYMVMNTILFDNELKHAQQYAQEAYNAGCDALIVQDMAFMEMALPPLPLFASTQTDNCTAERVKFLENIGFSRVILARELSLNEIESVRGNTSIDLEAFIHGSLCVSYSGRCYMSHAVTGRSANRGECSQMCRLPYDLFSANGEKLASKRHLLSLKDLNLSNNIQDLITAGISSFKIEGRLKDIYYVKNITAHYRHKIDEALNCLAGYCKSSSGEVTTSFNPNPEKSFSRGFTTYFANNRSVGMAAVSSKSTGQSIGVVKRYEKDYFITDGAQQPDNGDGICFHYKGELFGTRVNKAQDGKIYPLSMQGILNGTEIFVNSDRLFEKQLSGNSSVRKIRANVSVNISANYVVIQSCDEDGIKTRLSIEHDAPQADNIEKAQQTIKTQIEKTGNSIFIFKVDDVTGTRFFPLSEINGWRRMLAEAAEKSRTDTYVRNEMCLLPSNEAYITNNGDFTLNISNKLAQNFYRKHGVEIFEQAAELTNANKTLMFTRYCIKYEMGLCPSKQGAKNTGDLFLQTDRGTKFKLVFDCKKCEMRVEKL